MDRISELNSTQLANTKIVKEIFFMQKTGPLEFWSFRSTARRIRLSFSHSLRIWLQVVFWSGQIFWISLVVSFLNLGLFFICKSVYLSILITIYINVHKVKIIIRLDKQYKQEFDLFKMRCLMSCLM